MPASCDWRMTGGRMHGALDGAPHHLSSGEKLAPGCATRADRWPRPRASVRLCYDRTSAAQTALPQHKMTVGDYLAWAEGRPARFELYAGSVYVYAQTPERAGHAKVKYACCRME